MTIEIFTFSSLQSVFTSIILFNYLSIPSKLAYSHFTEQEADAQTSCVICPRSQWLKVEKPESVRSSYVLCITQC